jgi:phosphatidate cytidylyltransferase
VAGVLYIPALMLPQWHLRLTGYEWIVILYGMVWAADSCAYYVGKGIGRRRLYIEISPNKTVEGAAGSVIGATVAAVLLGAVMVPDAGMLFLIFTGAAIGIVSIAGDLVESMFKRDAGIKDSSSFIPGHGGLLDKIDSVLFAGPVLYVITLLR